MSATSTTEENTIKSKESESIVKAIVSELGADLEIDSFDALPPDASSRRYFRVSLSGNENKHTIMTSNKCLAMVFETGESQQEVSDTSNTISMEDAYVTLTRYFRSNKVEVPQIVADARGKGVILVEDLGDVSLGEILNDKDQYTDKQIEIFFRMAVDQIIKIQRSKPNYDLFAFQRSLSQEVYEGEVQEFYDFFLKDELKDDKQPEVISNLFALLSSETAARDKVLCHRDFHAWNLHLDSHGKVRVIDFQDALLGPAMYDIACLLNDRGVDKLLGEEKVKLLLKYFFSETGYIESGKVQSALSEYDLCLLQRDLKVVGRFSKLKKEKKLDRYGKWIPGTLFRIGQTLSRIESSKKLKIYSEALTFLTKNVSEIKKGSKSSLSFDDIQS